MFVSPGGKMLANHLAQQPLSSKKQFNKNSKVKAN